MTSQTREVFTHLQRLWRRAGLLVVAMLLVSPDARSLDLTSGVQLVEWCRAYADEQKIPEGRSCDAYLRGFVDGSPMVAIQEARRNESFTERAARTRLGRPVSPRPTYCIAGDVSVEKLVAQLLAHAESNPPRIDTDASVLIYKMLERYHACDE